ncbi:MAG: hypothetical protein R2726_04280 [Acidimicrobiales bacterium]
MNTLEQLRTLAAASLVAGEEAVAAVRVNYNGTVQPNAVATNPAVGGIADADAGGPDPDTLVAFPTAKQMALLLTGGRVLAWSLGFSGKPKHFIGEVPLSAVREVHVGEIRFGPLVRVVMKSGATVDLEILRHEDADGFVDHLRHLVDATAPPDDGPGTADQP